MNFEDQARPIREGEALDAERIDEWLRQQIPGLEGRARIGQFPGGASNLTYLVQYDNRDLVLRRPPFGSKAHSAHDMGREFTVMNGLQSVYPYVPKMLAFCNDDAVLGAEFYVMERLRGVILRRDPPKGLLLGPEEARKLCYTFVARLRDLHQIDWKQTPLNALHREGDFVARQVKGWCDRYERARTPDVPDSSELIAWLQANQPAQSRACIVHNDYRFDNLVLDPGQLSRVTGVLDWEMATIGDPLLDLGNSLAYWVEQDDPQILQMMRRQPTHLPGMMTRQQLIEAYLEGSGLQPDSFLFYEIFGSFRLAVIIQQIYYRFYHGQTSDKRFAAFGQLVNFLDGHLQQRIRAV